MNLQNFGLTVSFANLHLSPVHADPFLFENGDFLFRFGPHIFGQNGRRKCIFLKTLSGVKVFVI